MSTLTAGHRGPWTEADYFALGETSDRVELLDGKLVVSPNPHSAHQAISFELTAALTSAARAARLKAVLAPNVRLGANRILIPDVVIMRGPHKACIEVEDVPFAAEIVSPGNAATDRVTKMRVYAEAGIPRYLLVEPKRDGIDLRLFRLSGRHYVEQARATGDEPLLIDEPVKVELIPASLLDD